MIRLQGITLYQASKLLIDKVDLTLYPDQKIGITGANGCGKSSFFQLLKNEIQAESGSLDIPQKWSISCAKQETPPSNLSSLDYVLSGHNDYHTLQQKLKVAESASDTNEMARIHEKLDTINSWRLPTEAAKLLTGLSFNEEQIHSSVKSLSGGWRMRLNLAQALIQPADLLLLDEPTNHLDLEAVLWLQEYLKSYNSMLITISHDRDFLDTFCNHILHFENQKIICYKGNYSSFEKQKNLKENLQQAEYDKQQKKIQHLEKFVSRFKAKASKATQAQSRIKALEKMDRVSAVKIREKFSFEFPAIDTNISELLKLEDASVGYDQKTILTNINLRIEAGQRIGLLGKNGEGKSTLIKLICGDLPTQNGTRKYNKYFNAGYFAQHQVEQLNLDESAIWHIQSCVDFNEQGARNLLGGFAFHGDKTQEKVGSFSGGEKARLVLAMITAQKPTLLLLDEPTNHFDIEMREALSLALQTYDGAVILVAHDKNLMESVVDEYLLVNQGQVTPFEGDLNAYEKWLSENGWRIKTSNEKLKSKNSAKEKKDQKRLDAEKRNKVAPIKRKLNQIEASLENLQNEKNEIELILSNNELYEENNKTELERIINLSIKINKEIENLEEQWLSLSESLEASE